MPWFPDARPSTCPGVIRLDPEPELVTWVINSLEPGIPDADEIAGERFEMGSSEFEGESLPAPAPVPAPVPAPDPAPAPASAATAIKFGSSPLP